MISTRKRKPQRKYIRDGRAPIPANELTSRIMSSIRAKNTKPELLVRRAFCRVGLKNYRLHPKSVPGRPDIVFSSKKIAVFVHGCYWHRCPKCKPAGPKTHKGFWNNKFKNNVSRDRRKERDLKRLGWKVFVIWECETRNNKLHKKVQLIKKAYKKATV